MDVDIAILAGAIVGLLAVEPKDAGKDEIFFLHGIGGLPDAAGWFAPHKLGAEGGVVTDLLADAVPAEGSFMAVRFRTGAFFSGGDGERAGDATVFADKVESLGGDGDAKVHAFSLS